MRHYLGGSGRFVEIPLEKASRVWKESGECHIGKMRNAMTIACWSINAVLNSIPANKRKVR